MSLLYELPFNIKLVVILLQCFFKLFGCLLNLMDTDSQVKVNVRTWLIIDLNTEICRRLETKFSEIHNNALNSLKHKYKNGTKFAQMQYCKEKEFAKYHITWEVHTCVLLAPWAVNEIRGHRWLRTFSFHSNVSVITSAMAGSVNSNKCVVKMTGWLPSTLAWKILSRLELKSRLKCSQQCRFNQIKTSKRDS